MATKKITDQDAVRQENIETTVSKVEQFFNENKKTIWTVLGVTAFIILAVVGYTELIAKPKAKEAMAQMYPAEASFAQGEFELALNGDGNVLGFNDIIKEYGAKGGKSVYFYAGVCNLQLGQWEEAISLLKQYGGKDKIMAARAQGCIGDAYAALENYSEAVKYFKKAAAVADNVFAANYLLKEGVTYEELGDKAAALECYNKIKDNYPDSVEGYEIDKYISRAQAE